MHALVSVWSLTGAEHITSACLIMFTVQYIIVTNAVISTVHTYVEHCISYRNCHMPVVCQNE